MYQPSLDLLRTALDDALRKIVDFTPNALSAAVILVVGLVVAKLLQIVLTRLLRVLRVDDVTEKRAVLRPLRSSGIIAPASVLIGRVVFWLVMALFLVPTVEALRLPYVSELLGRLITYLPNLITGILIFLIGQAAARILSISVESSARSGGLEYATALGRVVRYLLNFVVLILALAQVGVQTDVLTNILTVLVVSLGLALALALGLGSRSVVNNLLAGAFARELFEEGAMIEIQGKAGKILAIRAVGTTLESDGRKITIPNALLIENIVE